MRVGGVWALANSVRKIADKELGDEMKAVTKAAAEKIVPYAKQDAPRGATGALVKSIKTESTRRFARIKAGTDKRVPYARAVHSGRYIRSTGVRTKGQPFIKRSIPKAYPEIIDEFVKGMSRIAEAFEKKHGVSRVAGKYGGTEVKRIKRR
jgi:hypothetical protein